MANNVNMLIPVTLTFGTSRALSTFVSQAYGSGNYKSCAELSNKHMILVRMLFVPVSILLWFITDILYHVGFNYEISIIAGTYTKWLIWGFYMHCMF